jgi:hypothetical protein
MEKKIFALLGVGFSDLRQIALTFCHSNVTRPESKIQASFIRAGVVLGP